ncbi:MAG: hypothetical protein V7741_03705 [Hyphomonas sp.]
MKRLLLTAISAAAIASAPALAQQAPALDGNNTSIISQRGNGNTADVNQAVGGTTNNQGYSSIEQLRGASGNVNNASATVRQSQGSYVMGGNDYANASVIEQRRNGAVAFVNQVHDYASSTQNSSTIRQLSANADASVRQRGDGNTATIVQRLASVTPTGAIRQNGVGNTARIIQESDGGSVVINQGTWAGPNQIVSPDSWDNDADVFSAGFNPLIRVNQFGSLNTADVSESGVDGIVRIDTDGVRNRADAFQGGVDNRIDIDQLDTGFRNTSDIMQEASSEDSLAKVEQSGYRARATITQRGGLENDALVTQSGLGATNTDILSTVLQDGSSNIATVDQFADSALSDVSQMGMMHVATISQ